MIMIDIKAIKARAERATAVDFHVAGIDGPKTFQEALVVEVFLNHARDDIPALVDWIERAASYLRRAVNLGEEGKSLLAELEGKP